MTSTHSWSSQGSRLQHQDIKALNIANWHHLLGDGLRRYIQSNFPEMITMYSNSSQCNPCAHTLNPNSSSISSCTTPCCSATNHLVDQTAITQTLDYCALSTFSNFTKVKRRWPLKPTQRLATELQQSAREPEMNCLRVQNQGILQEEMWIPPEHLAHCHRSHHVHNDLKAAEGRLLLICTNATYAPGLLPWWLNAALRRRISISWWLRWGLLGGVWYVRQ